jgi:hypothetical protein
MDLLVVLFAKHLLEKIPEVLGEKCYGCKTEHPSQIQHDVCIMMSRKEQVELFFEDLLEKLDVRDIIEDCAFREHHHKIKEVLLAMYL